MKIMEFFSFNKISNDSYSLLKAIKNIILSLLIAIITGTLLMICVYSINTNNMVRNVIRSLPIYKQEKLYYSFAPSVASSQLDNFTDATILNEAAFKRGSNIKQIINNALTNPHYFYNNLDPVNSLIQAYSTNNIAQVENYGRYWHGCNIYIKPLLYFHSVAHIRFLNMCIQFVLLILLIIELYKKGGAKLIIPISTGIIILNPISSVLSIQLSTMYYITLISTYILLKKKFMIPHPIRIFFFG